MAETSSGTKKTVGLVTAISIAVANMIGTGVFTSLGYQVVDIQSAFALVMLWVVGGVIALCGALSYGELGAALPRSGGEYHLLSEIYHPALGFLSGWVSLTAGFAAPTAIAAIALGEYTHAVFPAVPVTHLGALAVVLITLVHATSIRWGNLLQNVSTAIKVGVVLLFIVLGFMASEQQSISMIPTLSDWEILVSPFFAVALVYVSYAYTGWNAAVYIVGEIRNPQRNLPLALFIATVMVTVLYALLNYVFLLLVPIPELVGKVEVGFLAAEQMLGPAAADILSILIAVLMVSTISAMVFIGGRIGRVIGEDYRVFRTLSRQSDKQIPVNALIFQGVVTLFFLYTSSFEQVMIYATFLLIGMSSLTVAGVYVLRWQRPHMDRPYKTWGYPVTPALFLLANTFIMVYVVVERPLESLVGLAIMVVGILLYMANKKRSSFGDEITYEG
ncbi:amino acid/polyamine/organocation transporter, APC superfamily [Fodinibius roseus]|uniref:Amino acid/polyamine/organocation transporter, APC superfamily n=1 Tax=Fodinibius roseus TaxID=1194090 RepID=A0A1M4ZGI3_9BACT|nr:amino acid permease [Fodinibius roseus]SHF17068.1 amino acid/polyamine/organocation transporter, APC superfamily [Fodinibius roseus]